MGGRILGRMAVRWGVRAGSGKGGLQRLGVHAGDAAALGVRAVLGRVGPGPVGESLDLSQALHQPSRPARPDRLAGVRGLRGGHGQRGGRAQRPDRRVPPGRLPAVVSGAHPAPGPRPQRAGRRRGRALPAGAADRSRARTRQHRLPAAGGDLPGGHPASGATRLPGRRVRAARRRAHRGACGGGAVHGGRPGARQRKDGDGDGRVAGRGASAGPGDAAGPAGSRTHGDTKPSRAVRGGAAVVTGSSAALHGPGERDHAGSGHPPIGAADRIPGRVVPAGRVLPEREAHGHLRAQPASAVPLPGAGRAGAAATPGCRASPQRAELHHGALLALPTVPALPGRLRRAGPDGVGGGTRLGSPGRRGLAGPGAGRCQ